MSQIDTKESIALFSLLKASLFGKDIDIDFSQVDFSALYSEAKNQRVEGVVFQKIPSNLPENCNEVYKSWYNRALHTLSINLNISNAHVIINNLLKKNNIRYSIIKGCTAARYYPQPVYRSMGDVDFLVEPKDVKRVKTILEENGFVESEDAEEHSYHISFEKSKIHYELHFAVSDEGYGSSENFAKEVLNEAVPVQLYNDLGEIFIASEKHHCMIMLAHMKKHMVMYGMGLRHVCDWALFINKYSSEEFVSSFKEEIKRSGFWEFAQEMSQISHIYLGADYKDWFGKIDYENSKKLMEYIFASGNFGMKREGINWMFIEPTKRKTGGVFLQLYRSYVYLVGEMFPKAKNNKLLFVLCFIYAPFRYIFRVITGKKKLYNPFKLFSNGKQIVENSKIIDKYKD